MKKVVLLVFAHYPTAVDTFRAVCASTDLSGSRVDMRIDAKDATYYFRKASEPDDARNVVGVKWDEVYILSPEQTSPDIFREIRFSMKLEARAYIWRLPNWMYVE